MNIEQIKIGMRVEAGEGADYDTGRVDAIDLAKGTARIAWDTLVETSHPIAALSPIGTQDQAADDYDTAPERLSGLED